MTALREDSNGNRHTCRSRLGYAGLSALVLAGAALGGRRAFERDAVPMSPRPVHAFQPERREVHLRSGDLLLDAEHRCAWPNGTTGQVSSTDVEQAAKKHHERLFGHRICSASSFIVGDLDGDRRDDVVAELWCSMPDVGRYQDGVAVFLNVWGRGLTLASVQRFPFPVALERLCDGVVTVEVDINEHQKSAAIHFGSQYADDGSYAVNLRLRGGRLTAE